MIKPLVSVCLITYNHEKYIAEAIDSVLTQRAAFTWELIIAEDCSTDRTRAIILEYKARHPNLIKLILQEKNVGPAKNWIDLISTPTSKYIAYLEGDDYWTDPLKLQKQVDFLEANENFVLCHSDVTTINVNGELIEHHQYKSWNNKTDHLDYRLAIFNPIAFSSTSLYRNIISPAKISQKIVAGDWMLFLLLTLKGDAKFMNEKFSIYRLGSGVSLGAVWHNDFHNQSLFLLRQVSLNKSFTKNSWLVKGALYFVLMQMSKRLKITLLSDIANKLKFKIK